jgi:hypothetical protein
MLIQHHIKLSDMKTFFTSLLLFLVISLNAQVGALLEFNNVRARVNNNGLFFHDTNGPNGIWQAAFEVPKGEGVSSIYTSSFWMGGKDQHDNLRLAALRYAEYNEYSIGPKSTNSNSDFFQSYYNSIWRITRQEILSHQANYANAGYQMPSSIATWPGNGNTSNGEAHFLAPFIDVNGDGFYNPSQGDYPDVPGDEALYFMLNDANGEHQESGGQPIGVDIHVSTYAYATSEESPLNNCVFVRLQIRNNGTAQLSDFYVGVYTDWDLGAYNDDYIGSDSLRNMTYAYNGDGFDEEVSGSPGYGNYLPAQGSVFLNHEMAKAVYYNNSTSPINGELTEPEHYYNFMRGHWKDGTIITEGGHGYGGSVQANYMYSGDPMTGEGWTEVSAGNSPADRRMVMSTGPFTFLPGDQLCVDIAYPFARGTIENDNGDAILKLRDAVDYIQEFYDSQDFSCNHQLVGVANEKASFEVSIHPNPNNGKFYVSANEDIVSLEVMNAYGQLVYAGPANKQGRRALEVDLTQHASGIYFYRVALSDGKELSGKVLVD